MGKRLFQYTYQYTGTFTLSCFPITSSVHEIEKFHWATIPFVNFSQCCIFIIYHLNFYHPFVIYLSLSSSFIIINFISTIFAHIFLFHNVLLEDLNFLRFLFHYLHFVNWPLSFIFPS
jgi:hypothetical protein